MGWDTGLRSGTSNRDHVKKRILFVGEDQPLWQEFENLCGGADSAWQADFAGTGPGALALVEQFSFDAIVVDVDLSGMSGVDLLDCLQQWQPKAVRVVVSDIENAPSTVKCLGRAHHHLLKPCDAPMMIKALNQALAMESWLPSDAVRGLIARMRWVPSPPGIYAQILKEMRSPDASVEKIGELIAQDPAVTAKVLQLANSAVFALQLQVVHPTEAVAYIGLETTRALVVLAHTFSSFNQLHLVGFSGESLWRHSVLTGELARRVATLEDSGPELTEQAFAAGLLHDIGKLLFAANLSEPFGQAVALARAQNCRLWEAESRVFGASHAEMGACVLGIWGLPTPIVEAVALHHHPSQSKGQEFSPLTAVHVANVFEHDATPAGNLTELPEEFDVAYLKRLGVDQRMEERRRKFLGRTEAATAENLGKQRAGMGAGTPTPN